VDESDKQRIEQQLREVAERLFPGLVRQASLLQYGDEPMVEPGEVMFRALVSEQPGDAEGTPDPVASLSGPAMKEFQRELLQRVPEVRRIEILEENADGKRKGRLMRVNAVEPKLDSDLTAVMVRMRAAELEIVDTLISVGIAANRAEAVRWALARISERPAYAQLRERTREIERLKAEF
jgi:hypothetical protein